MYIVLHAQSTSTVHTTLNFDMFSNSEKVTSAYVLARRPGPNNTKVILQRNPDGNAARSHVLLINSQLPGAQLGTATRSSARGNAPNSSETNLLTDSSLLFDKSHEKRVENKKTII